MLEGKSASAEAPRIASDANEEAVPPHAWLTVLAVSLGSTMAVLALATRPTDRELAAGVFAPWRDQAAAITAAAQAGQVTGVGALPFIVIVRAPGRDAAAGLRRAGALFSIAPPQGLGCGSASP